MFGGAHQNCVYKLINLLPSLLVSGFPKRVKFSDNVSPFAYQSSYQVLVKIVYIITSASSGLDYNGSPSKEVVANVGEKVLLKCETAISFSYCQFKSPSGEAIKVRRFVYQNIFVVQFSGGS